MKEGTRSPAPAGGTKVPEVPAPPPPRGTPGPRIAVPQPRPSTGRAALPDGPVVVPDRAGRVELEPPVLALLSGRDEWTARSVASLLWSARLAGRAEAALTAGQVEILLGALGDAVALRRRGAGTLGCLDCKNEAEGRCSSHAHDLDRALAYSELALLLAARA
jgi:hypothetical protein